MHAYPEEEEDLNSMSTSVCYVMGTETNILLAYVREKEGLKLYEKAFMVWKGTKLWHFAV